MEVDNTKTINVSQKPIVTNQFTKKNSNKAITSLVLGILSIIISWTIITPLITGIIGIIFGIASLAKKRDSKNLAIVGIALSVIGFLIGLLLLLLLIIADL